MKNINIIRELTSIKLDLILLQETFITSDNIAILNYTDEDYNSIGIGATFSEKNINTLCGRPQGGLAVLWRKDSGFTIELMHNDNDYMAVLISFNNFSFVIVNVYIRSDLGDPVTLNNYLENLYKLENIIEETNCQNILFFGDWNADPYHGRTWANLTNFINRNSLSCFDYLNLPNDTFTHISYSHSHCKWLDHLIGKLQNEIKIKSMNVLYDIIGSDHLPIHTNLYLQETIVVKNNSNIDSNAEKLAYINWKALTEDNIKSVSVEASILQENFYEKYNVSLCQNITCNSQACLDQIDSMYDDIVKSIYVSSSSYLRDKVKFSKFKVVPGWNRRVKQLYKESRYWHKIWLNDGKNRLGISYENMKESKRIFKKELKNCKKDKDLEIALSLEENIIHKNYLSFWKKVKAKRGHTSNTSVIDGKTKESEIIKIFTDKFLLCNNDENNKNKYTMLNKFNELYKSDRKAHLCISDVTLKKLIKRLNIGVGHDNIHSLLLANSNDDFINNIVVFLNCIFKHSHIPTNLLNGEISPIVKDKKGNLSDSNNYRPIMQSSNILKIIELFIQDILLEKIVLNSRQFGFLNNISTSHATLLIKETIYSYKKYNNKVYALFADLSKAFDLVDHFKLGNILLNRGIPSDLVKIIMSYLRNQCARIKWNNQSGEYNYIDKGVRQGGILSPLLFKIYIDDLLCDLNKMNEGCIFGITRITLVAYADDVVLLSNNREGLNKIYKEFKIRIENLELKINIKKTKCIIFYKSEIKESKNNNLIKLQDNEFEVVSSIKYLGNIINFNLDDRFDVELKLNSFYKSFYSILSNFSNVNIETFLFLFNSYCLPNYGLELWYSYGLFMSKYFKTFEIAYCKALKKICNVPNYTSNHFIAAMCNQFLLFHLVNLIRAKFIKRLDLCKNPIYILNKIYFKVGEFHTNVSKIFKKVYNINIYNFKINIIKSRIEFVQLHEA